LKRVPLSELSHHIFIPFTFSMFSMVGKAWQQMPPFTMMHTVWIFLFKVARCIYGACD
jgi:hypothetical protein